MSNNYTAAKHIQGELVTVEKLHKHVRNYWIMAESGSGLHFITACFHTTSASGVICLLVAILHTYTMFGTIKAMLAKDYDSDYRWSVIVILIVQSIGVVIGTIVPLFRCFTTLRFKVFFSIHFKVFKVESYWTQKLYEWKRTIIRLPFRSCKLEVVIETFKRLFFNIWIQLQKGVVVLCKIIALIPLRKKENMELNEYIRPYVLYLDNEMWVGEKTLEGFSKSVKPLIQIGAKRQPCNLIRLIQLESTIGFHGVANFDHTGHHHIPSILSSVQYTDVPSSDCWSLPVVTLTMIALSLPELENQAVDCLFESVREGLRYVQLVEESLNCTYDRVSFQKAARTLWDEIKFEERWLGNKLRDFQVHIARQIVEWFRDKATHYLSGDGNTEIDSIGESICADSMHRITETILRTFYTNNDAPKSQEELFETLSSMIADIIGACLTNLPQIITMKCHTYSREERQARVKDAAKLLGETTQIIEMLQDHDIPNIYPSDMPFLGKWRAYFRESLIP
ncbi:hypothetical protein HanXRQr2_Chr10g0463481 [Helianthus annuus]|uniref:Uncharacterized protein n=1 Tax=Helianthus annuus TaxID=4232 RepID=A0A9K3N689_HELAN|nr:hypothetical protein HanXRQr2_Chr10g0463481 [Helianthus annuus]KAJ0515432.1 hypothetical protein HanHA300_Chr10g0380491 [Helianthus annuus]KAJ0701808.1 hypothetical protein HanOQP8_Chr10g0383421 [Helianthus annuus]KAJ0885624.1 hypothetical protein HanPSC8_Chr10g0447261 [Helianthus annuus]